MKCEMEFKKLNDQTDYVNRVEPLTYTGKLILGILCVILSSNWLFVIAFNMVNLYILSYVTDKFSKATTDLENADFVNKIMHWCMENNLSYMANVIFVAMTLYLFATTFKGNQTIGFRFASPTFYPMRSNETQLNAFMFNILILNASSLGATMFCCEQLNSYTSKSYLYKYTTLFKYSDFMFWLTDNLIIG